ncbi:MAG: hypothetical protein AUJ07_08770 [Crenarchaeota archaeon 13_1_40CM_3_53_5]|nr:MAG: hypothetical protein AUJ07_08770 [Crenarchaeota archaeon 13_1_40CM_3_53_5]
MFIDDDEEAPKMLFDYLKGMKPRYPYYWIRRVNLWNGRYVPVLNPDYEPRLVSSSVRFHGWVHERVVPRKPHGWIDIPIIHNHVGPPQYRYFWFQDLPVYRFWLASKKLIEVARGR